MKIAKVRLSMLPPTGQARLWDVEVSSDDGKTWAQLPTIAVEVKTSKDDPDLIIPTILSLERLVVKR